MEIILLRHGKPVLPELRKMNAVSFREWVRMYNEAGLCASSTPSQEAIRKSKNCNAVVCSSLPRSIESAKTLSKNEITLSSELFNEAGLPISNWQVFKLSPKAWAILFRAMWLFGYSNNSESFKQAKCRAQRSVQILQALALEHESVLFVGHGIYNRLIAKELRANGWTGPGKPGSKHWSFSSYILNKYNKALKLGA